MMRRLVVFVGVVVIISAVLITFWALPVVAANKQPSLRSPKSATVTLYGHIDELSFLCSSAGIKIGARNLPSEVSKVSLGSAAAYAGIRVGDQILRADAQDNVLILTVKRNHKTYQATIATDVKGLKAEFEALKIPFSFGDSPFDKELKGLAECDIVILLDRCKSMADNHAGCPGDLSKWVWCKQQIDSLYLSTERVLESGFNLVLFNDKYQISSGVTFWDLKHIFDQIKPDGIQKNTSLPLAVVLKDYFHARAINTKPANTKPANTKPANTKPANTKPLVILVLTDNVANTGQPLQNVLIEASRAMTRPGEIVVTFLQVGESISAEDLFDDLDQNLVAKGARYHLVNYKPFAEFRNKGLLWELLWSVRESM